MTMNFTTFLNRFFGRDENDASKKMAKERLRLLLVHDRLDVSEQTMNALRVDLIAVIGKYFGIDETAVDVSLSREAEGVALLANIPILGPKRNAELKTNAPEPVAPAKEKTAPTKDKTTAPAPAMATVSPAKEKSAPPKQEAASPKQEAAPPKQAATPPKQSGNTPKGGKKGGQAKQPLPKNPNPEQAMEAYIK